MKDFKYILFDLDGTITDSAKGITDSVKYALKKMGEKIPPYETLCRFIGPPLKTGFSEFCGLNDEMAEKADIDAVAIVTPDFAHADIACCFADHKKDMLIEKPLDEVVLHYAKTAKAAGLELGMKGSIKVDSHMRTSDPNIYAVGDSVEIVNPVTGKTGLVALAGPANRQARIAADNICGIPSEYLGTQGSTVIKVFDMTAAVTGLNEKSAQAAGV